MRKSKSVFESTVADALIERMKNEGLCIYYRNTGKVEKYELIDRSCVHVEWVHPDTVALAHSRLQYVGEYKTSSGDSITVYRPGKGK